MNLAPSQDTMYVYGGALLPSEEITNELWALDLTNLTWTLLPPPPVPSPTYFTTEPDTTVTSKNEYTAVNLLNGHMYM